ncbi:MAG: hypothetical protein NZL92_08270 [Gloeomargarita sp. SKYG116]|nr:hypothetical protein [Gloeomargarita sp. SKYG116]MCS7293618.1 hypothetical protein [Gloeomargarita sp. SKYB120]MDW8179184.1 hypothetical protein [Gloeomargarita sp. SKYBB_i_bin120]MDW8401677.1 hypothetical protein [Gloeomargarita sp. SKYGB_i_bin116]
MWARLRALLQKEPQPALQLQREALVDLLLLGMYVDHRLSVAETDVIHDQLLDMPWESGMALSIYIQSNMPRIRTAYENLPARWQLLQSIRDRLATPDARRDAYQKLQEFLAVDGIAQGEQELLTQVRTVLGLSR